MEEKEVLIFEAIFDVKNAKQNAELLAHVIGQLKKEKQETDKEFKKGIIGAEEYAKSIQAIDTQLVKAQSDYKAVSKEIADYTKVQAAAAGSVDQLKAKLELMVKQFDALPGNLRKSASVGGELAKQINELTGEIEDADKATGRHKQTIGDYSERIEQAITGQNTWISRIRQTKESLSDALTATKNYLSGLKATTEGMSFAQKATLALNLGLKALGIGALLAVFSALVTFLTQTQAGMNFVEKATKSLSAVFNVLIDTGMQLAHALTTVFESPKKAYEELKRILSGIPEAVSAAVTAGAALATSTQNLREQERALNVERANSRARIEELKLAAEDVTKSTEARAAAAKEAFAIENGLLQRQIGVQQEKIRLAKEELRLGQDTAEARDKVAEAEIELGNLREESFGKQTELNNKVNELTIQGIQQRLSVEIAAINQTLRLQEQAGTYTFDSRKKLLQKQLEFDLAAVAKGSQQEKALRLKYAADLAQLEFDTTTGVNDKIRADRERDRQIELDAIRQGTIEELNIRLKQLDDFAFDQAVDAERQIELQKELIDTQLKAKQTQIDQEIELKAEQLRKERKLDKLSAEERNKIEEQFAGKRKQIESQSAEDRAKLEEELAKRKQAIDAKSLAEKRAIERQKKDIEIAGQNALLAARLAGTKEGSDEEYEIQMEGIRKRISDALYDERVGYEEFKQIQAEGYAAMEALDRRKVESFATYLTSTLTMVASGLSNLFNAQAQEATRQITEQQATILKSAGLSAEARTKIEERFAKKKEQIDREAAEKRRKIATVENIINTASALVTALKEPFPYDLIKTALIIATSAAQQSVIASTKFEQGGVIPDQKLARGGMVNGPSHAEGGVKYQIGRQQVELEGGEGVINKHAMRIPWVREQASELNQMAGNGVAFDKAYSKPDWQKSISLVQYRGPVRFAVGGLTPLPTSSTVDVDYDKLGQVVSGMVVQAVKALPPSFVAVSDVRQGIGKQVKVEQNATIR